MKNAARVAILSLLSISSAGAMAEGWFVPRVEYSYTNYEQSRREQTDEQGGNTNADQEQMVSLNFLTIGGGATIGYSAFYVDFDYKATQDSELHQFYNGVLDSGVEGVEINDNGAFDRNEITITSGFGFEYISIFGGVKLTSTKFEHELYYDYQDPDDPSNDYPIFLTETGVPVGTFTEYKSTGLFGGVNVQFILGENGALSFNAAYSQIVEATIQDDWYDEGNVWDLKSTKGNGLSASAKLSYRWLYARVDYASYTYSEYENQADNNVTFSDDVTEQFFRVGGGISILF